MKNTHKKLLALILVIALLSGILVLTASADETTVYITQRNLNSLEAGKQYLAVDSINGTDFYAMSAEKSGGDYSRMAVPVEMSLSTIAGSSSLLSCIFTVDLAGHWKSDNSYLYYSPLLNTAIDPELADDDNYIPNVLGADSIAYGSYDSQTGKGGIFEFSNIGGVQALVGSGIACSARLEPKGSCFQFLEGTSPYFAVYEVSLSAAGQPDTPPAEQSGGYSASLQSNAASGGVVTVSLDSADPAAELQVVATGSEDCTSIAAGELVLTYDTEVLSYVSASAPASQSCTAQDANGTVKVEFYGQDCDIGAGFTVDLEFQAKNDAGGKTGTVALTFAAFSDASSAGYYNLKEASRTSSAIAVKVVGRGVSVDLCEGLTGASSANVGGSYEFSRTADSAYRDYSGMVVTMNGTAITPAYDEAAQTYTIANVTGNISVTGVQGRSYAVSYSYLGNVAAAGMPPLNEQAVYLTDYVITVPDMAAATNIEVLYSVGGTASAASVRGNGEYYVPGAAITGPVQIIVSAVQVSVNPSGTGAQDFAYSDAPAMGQDFTFTVNEEAGYDYRVSATVDGETVNLTEGENGTYTIASEDVTGRIVVFVEKTVNTANLSVYSYVTLDEKLMWLIVDTGAVAEGKVRTYDGSPMLYSEAYEGYCCLQITANSKTAEGLLTAAVGAVGITDGSPVCISYLCDVNMTGEVDANDAQLVWNIYNARYDSFDSSVSNGLAMEKLLRADINGDKKVMADDAAAVISAVLAG